MRKNQFDLVQSDIQSDTVWYSLIQSDTVWYSLIQSDTVWYHEQERSYIIYRSIEIWGSTSSDLWIFARLETTGVPGTAFSNLQGALNWNLPSCWPRRRSWASVGIAELVDLQLQQLLVFKGIIDQLNKLGAPPCRVHYVTHGNPGVSSCSHIYIYIKLGTVHFQIHVTSKKRNKMRVAASSVRPLFLISIVIWFRHDPNDSPFTNDSHSSGWIGVVDPSKYTQSTGAFYPKKKPHREHSMA